MYINEEKNKKYMYISCQYVYNVQLNELCFVWKITNNKTAPSLDMQSKTWKFLNHSGPFAHECVVHLPGQHMLHQTDFVQETNMKCCTSDIFKVLLLLYAHVTLCFLYTAGYFYWNFRHIYFVHPNGRFLTIL